MKLEQSFEVAAPIERVWSALIDLEQVAPCLPGAAITGRDDDGTYRGEFTVKLGPTTANYRGTIKIESTDEATHTATLAARRAATSAARAARRRRSSTRSRRPTRAARGSTRSRTSRSPAGWPPSAAAG